MSKAGKKVIEGLTLVLVAVATYVVVTVAQQPVVDYFAAKNYQPSSDLTAIINNLDLTDRSLKVLFATHPVLQSRADYATNNCNNNATETSTLGCYDQGVIYVYNSGNDELDGLEESTVAHELLHALWERMYFFERSRLEPLLDQFYQTHKKELKDYIDGYDQSQYYTELHSVIGTRYASAELTPDLRQHYAAFFNDQDLISDYYKKYNQVMDELTAKLETLKANIETRRQVIDERKVYYDTEIDKLNRDIESFNTRVANHQITSERYQYEQPILMQRRTDLIEYYNETSRLVDEVNEIITEFNEIAVHQGELIKSIDSKPQEIKESE